MDRHSVWVTMEAIEGREEAARAFLREVAERLRAAEPGTTSYHAVQLDERRFGVFSTFLDDAALAAHANGIGAWIEARRPEFFETPYNVSRGVPFAVR